MHKMKKRGKAKKIYTVKKTVYMTEQMHDKILELAFENDITFSKAFRKYTRIK